MIGQKWISIKLIGSHHRGILGIQKEPGYGSRRLQAP